MSILCAQLQTLEETKKISQAIPILQRGTREAFSHIEAVLDSVKSVSHKQRGHSLCEGTK